MTQPCAMREWLSAYLDDALDARRLAAVEAHLDGCEACRAELAALRRLSGVLHGWPTPEADPQLSVVLAERLRARAVRPAWRPAWVLGTIMLLLTGGGVFYAWQAYTPRAAVIEARLPEGIEPRVNHRVTDVTIHPVLPPERVPTRVDAKPAPPEMQRRPAHVPARPLHKPLAKVGNIGKTPPPIATKGGEPPIADTDVALVAMNLLAETETADIGAAPVIYTRCTDASDTPEAEVVESWAEID